ncbi:MAG: phosphoribosylglycinamide formyltransferase [Gammaproteobacteria bacterium]|nr:MAG: phosphoribosylglycinamide formyltransferase [Gammaproteobacteria bacterium]
MAGAAQQPLPIVVLISGHGSNLEAIIEANRRSELPVDIRAVICNRPDAGGIEISRQAGIETRIIDHTRYADRAGFDAALQTAIDAYNPGLVVLAGFMRILTPGFVDHYRGRLINIHPSLLPEFPGLNTHQRALDAGRQVAGATVHFVTAETDGGPAFLQVQVAVQENDTAETLAERVLQHEHRLYPEAIRRVAEGRIALDEKDRVLCDGIPLETACLLEPDVASGT